MKKINSGSWVPFNDDPISLSKRVCAGIRSNPHHYVDVLLPEQIFVSIVGRSGSYRHKDDVDKILEEIGLDIIYQHNVLNEDDQLIYDDIEIHTSIFDGLCELVDLVYPISEDEQVVEINETEGDDRPF